MRKKEQVIITVCSALAILFVVLAWLWLVPQVEKKDLEHQGLSADIAEYENKIASLNEAKGLIDNAGSVNGLPISEANILRALPFAEEKEDIYALIENMALSAGITDPISMTVNETTATDSGVAQIPISVSTSGNYGAVTSFIKLFQETLRPVIINSLDIFPTENGALSLSISAKAYALVVNNGQDTEAVEENLLGESGEPDGISNLEARAQIKEEL